MSDHPASETPYPGLRPFQSHESHLFFGREEQTDELLDRLAERHFLAVVGSSGCGKSSLVRAGLLNGLEAGFMASAGSRWRFATMQPGRNPIERLAEALGDPEILGRAEEEGIDMTPFLVASLRRGPRSLVDALESRPLADGGNLLLLIDQFEELFRFRAEGGADEADAFVALLLETARAGEEGTVPVYVVITMRSDFLGDCSFFKGLPETINDGQYLTPRMNREQQVEAIRSPARVLGGDVDEDLLNRLLNDLGHDLDQLPLMQHLLAMMWEQDAGELSARGGPFIDLDDYDRVGGLKGALSGHIELAYGELDPGERRLAELFFRALAERTPAGRDVRTPTTLGSIASSAGASVEEMAEIANVFRAEGRNFVTPGASVPIDADTIIDISHESLLRQWPRMTEWLADEAASAETYRRLAENALIWKAGEASLWRTPNLELALAWKEERERTAEWARRYDHRVTRHRGNPSADETFAHALEFLEASAQEQRREEAAERRNHRRMTFAAGSLAVLAVALIWSLSFVWSLLDETERLKDGASAALSQELALAQPELGLWLMLYGYDISKDKRSAAKLYETLTLFAVPPRFTLPNTPSKPADEVDEAVLDLSYGPEGDYLVATRGADLVKWNMEGMTAGAGPSGELVKVGLYPNALAVSSTGLVAIGDAEGNVQILDPESGDTASLVDPEPLRGLFVGERAHLGAVNAAAFGPEGAWVATGGSEGNINIWVRQGAENRWQMQARLRPRDGRDGAVWSLASNPDPGGRFLLASGSDSIVRLWHFSGTPTTSGVETATSGAFPSIVVETRDIAGVVVPNPDIVRALALGEMDDVLILAQGDDKGVIKLWRIHDDGSYDLERVDTVSVARVRDAAFSPDGISLAVASEDGRGYLYIDWTNVRRRPESLVGHIGMVTAVAFAPDGASLSTGSMDGTVKVWATERESPSPQRAISDTVHGPERLRGVAFDDSGFFATTGDDGRVALWDHRVDTIRPTLVSRRAIDQTITARGVSVAFAHDNPWLAVASLEGNKTTIWSVDGDTLSSGPIASLNPSLWTPFDSTSNRWVWDVAFSPGDSLFATASADGFVRIWDARPGSALWAADSLPRPRLELGAEVSPLKSPFFKTAVAFSPMFLDDSLIATASRDDSVRVIKLNPGGPADLAWKADTVWTLAHRGDARSVAFSPDGTLLATAGDDQTVRIWNLEDDASEIIQLEHGDVVWSVAFNEDGSRLASSSYDGNVRVWNVEALPDVAAVVQLHDLPVPLGSDVRDRARLGRIAFSPLSDVLLVGSWDSRAYLYDWNSSEVYARGWNLITRAVRDDDCLEYLSRDTCPTFFRSLPPGLEKPPPYARVDSVVRRDPGY